MRRNFCATGDVLLWLQRCDFRTVKKPSPLTTAAQNIHVFLRESSLHKKHFFEWLETAISSNACGMSNLKSLPSRAFFVSDVHLRPRKHFSRCTLDCGFKTSESPALRGFVGGLRALATAALYLVLKSNGLRHSKNPPVKFSFSLKIVPATIAKKLPPQRCFKPLLIPIFNFSHKRPTFAFTSESGYTLGFRRKIAHKGTHGETGAFQMGCYHCEKRLTLDTKAKHGAFQVGWYYYPRSVLRGSETLRGRVSERQTLPLFGLGRVCSRRTRRACGTAMRSCASLFRGVAAPLGCVIFFQFCRNCSLYALRLGLSACARHGVVSLPSARFARC